MIENHKDTMQFFRQKIKKILSSKKVSIQEPTEFYVVQLLSSFSSPQGISQHQDYNQDEALALLLARAMEAQNPHERFAGFKALGDRSLFISGIFGDSLKEKIVNLNYYAQMGQHAYQVLSQISAHNNFSEIFMEIASKFHFLVDTLSELSEEFYMTSNEDILNVYERWVQLKSDRLLKKLIKQGVDPFHEIKKKNIH